MKIPLILTTLSVLVAGKAVLDDCCVPLSQCGHKTKLLLPCEGEENLYCCAPKDTKNTTTLLSPRGSEHFPEDCGLSYLGNKITGGDTADIGQYPWMALLGYKQKQADFIEYLCGGTIITDKYVLTAAHCLAVGKNHELVNVRLGEHNLQSEIDCAVSLGVIYCSDKPVDVPVEEYLQHSEFDFSTLKNDIALVKLKTPVTFTEYIQPICLPFERTMEDLSNQASKTFIIAGWGKSGPKKVGGSPVLQFANVRIWNQSDCNLVVPPEVKPLADNQFCANGRKEDACKGDSGGPLFDLSVDATDEVRFHQLGIVSFASTVTCGIADLPSVYTRVEKHLDWILSNVN